MTSLPHIPPAIARKLGYYVYLYVDPADISVLCIGVRDPCPDPRSPKDPLAPTFELA